MAVMYTSPRSHGKSFASTHLGAVKVAKILVNTGHCEFVIYNKNKIQDLKNLIRFYLCSQHGLSANEAIELSNKVLFIEPEVVETNANVIFKDEADDCINEITKIYLQDSK